MTPISCCFGRIARIDERLPHNKHWITGEGNLACAAISFWKIALLFRKNRLVLPTQHTPSSYMEDIIESLCLNILPLTPAIAALAEMRYHCPCRPGRPIDRSHHPSP
ncbi:MAG: hypothetical protein M0Q44_21855 [Methylobacter sp.]|nr:hypothetical protein [Methylobacter sp.]